MFDSGVLYDWRPYSELPKNWQKKARDYAHDYLQSIENEQGTGYVYSDDDPAINEYLDEYEYSVVWYEPEPGVRIADLEQRGRW